MYQPLHFNTKEEEFDGAAERLSWCNRSDFPYDKVKGRRNAPYARHMAAKTGLPDGLYPF